MPTMSPTHDGATVATRTGDPPPEDDASPGARDGPFTVTATGFITFKAGEAEDKAQKLRVQLKATYRPPVVTLRFNVELFGYSHDRKKAKTTMFLDVPRDHIAALEHTALVGCSDARELARDDLPSGSISQLRFLLRSPGRIVKPVHNPLQAIRPNSQPTRAAIISLATAREFVLFVAHNTFSLPQIRSLQHAVTRPSEAEAQKQHKEHVHWLGTLYGGAGGKVLDMRPTVDADTPSESGDSTVPISSPPGYKRVTRRGDPMPPSSEDLEEANDAAAAVTPPPYVPEDGDLHATTDKAGRLGEKRPLDCQGGRDRDYRRRLGKGPRLASSGPPSPSGPLFTEGTVGPAYTALHDDGPGRGSHVALVSMLEEVLGGIDDLREENRSIKAQLSAIQTNQGELHAQMAEMAELHRQRHGETRALGKRCDDTDRELARIEERVEGTEEQYRVVTSEITEQVRGTLREALRGALGSIG